MLETDYRQAALPLFEEGAVDVLEWSFDMVWGDQRIPDWADGLLDFYGGQNRLLGHGVSYSAFSGKWHHRQEQWIESLRKECDRRPYLHLSEHFGFMTAGSFHRSASLPVPRTAETRRIGRERMVRLHDACHVPVGLENLAFAFGRRDVEEQGRFLDEILEAVDGFLVLDLHNIHCQSCNFGVPALELIRRYPLERAWELHISGGSWSESAAEPERGLIRRDTHDGAVPEAVFEMLPDVLALCPNVRAVIFERLGGTFHAAAEREQFARDFRRIHSILGERTANDRLSTPV